MQGSTLGLIVARVLQLLCACVVLGTSVDVAQFVTSPEARAVLDACKADLGAQACSLGGLVPATEFSAFVGAWGLLDAILGLTSAFLTAIPWVAVAVVDALAAIFYLAGGIRVAVWIGDYGCDATSKCTDLKADAAFMLLGFLVTVVLIVLGFMWQRGGGGSKLHNRV